MNQGKNYIDSEMLSDNELIDRCEEVVHYLQMTNNEDFAEAIYELCLRFDLVSNNLIDMHKSNDRRAKGID